MTCDALFTGLAADARVAARRVCRARREEGRADAGATRERVADADMPERDTLIGMTPAPLMTPSPKEKGAPRWKKTAAELPHSRKMRQRGIEKEF